MIYRRLTVPLLIKAAESVYGLERGAITDLSMARELMRPRGVVALLGHVWLGHTFRALGRYLKAHHSTPLRQARLLVNEIETDPGIVDELRSVLETAMMLAGMKPLDMAVWNNCLPWITKGQQPPFRIMEPTIILPTPQTPAAADSERESEDDDDDYGRRWWEENNIRFVQAMREAHPEMEVRLRAP